MIFYVTGDCHGQFSRFDNLHEFNTETPVGIICLGDFGINFYLNKNDEKNKKWLCNKYKNFVFYVVKGNHEARPSVLKNIQKVFDNEVFQYVWQEPAYPNIRYLCDGVPYFFGKYIGVCIGGAYSVDNFYRLARGNCTEETNDPKLTGWFADEQLTKEEMEAVASNLKDTKVDFVFTHTCPIDFQPSDLFLSFIVQSKVDNTMEIWMDEIKNTFDWNIWCFGHYHADRIERPHVEQFFKDMEELNVIYERWDKYDETGELDWWLNKSPNFYMK